MLSVTKIFSLIIFSLLSINLNTQDTSEFIKLFQTAADDKSKCEKLIELTKSKSNALEQAYHGAGLVMMANHVWAPTSKLSNFNKGSDELDAAVEKDSNNPEIRFLRYSIQLKAPGFLNYKDNLKEDRKIIFEKLKGYNKPEFQIMAANFLLENDKCSEMEINFLNQWKIK